MEKTEDVLIECARVYNRVWREALKGRDYYDGLCNNYDRS